MSASLKRIEDEERSKEKELGICLEDLTISPFLNPSLSFHEISFEELKSLLLMDPYSTTYLSKTFQKEWVLKRKKLNGIKLEAPSHHRKQKKQGIQENRAYQRRVRGPRAPAIPQLVTNPNSEPLLTYSRAGQMPQIRHPPKHMYHQFGKALPSTTPLSSGIHNQELRPSTPLKEAIVQGSSYAQYNPLMLSETKNQFSYQSWSERGFMYIFKSKDHLMAIFNRVKSYQFKDRKITRPPVHSCLCRFH
ncbi:hypothetical protein M9H77_02486 [Catharanthus roseus]|uniref:Uncharacterized protein n=1 Tax=Catharanthus roseus TaxID=4058 RepID=A0ACC0C8I8_CATRO|nr:hypothetical protein M9H77_02486 [Catharanthus roseus]